MKQSKTGRSRKTILALISAVLALLLVSIVMAGCGESSQPTDTAATTPTDASSVTAVTTAADATSDATDAEYTDVAFDTDDGLTLTGRAYGSGTSAVVLCHMYPADQTSWHTQALQLAEEGYFVLTFDFRGYGFSDGTKDIQYIDRDVIAAVGYLQTEGAQEIVLVGASMGGTASLVAAAELQALSSIRISGVATLSAAVEFMGLTARDAAAAIDVALLFVAAENDEGAANARELQSLSGDKGDLQIIPGTDHGTNLFTGSQSTAAWTLLLDFVRLCMPMGG